MPGLVGGQVAKRLVTMLLDGVEFSTRARAVRATLTVEGAVRGLCGDGSVTGSVVTQNAVGEGGRAVAAEAVVRVLAVRRKKKT